MSPASSTARMQVAAEWFIRLREAPEDAELVVQWLKWCQADPANLQAFGEASRLWRLAGNAGAATENAPAVPVRRRFRWAYAAGLAAMLLISVLALRQLQTSDSPATEYATAQAVERTVRLADGSMLELGAASAVRVSYSAARRELQLLRGEAYFEVQHARRPFIVKTPSASVRAVGTQFNVRTGAMRTVVTVTQGLVEIAPAGQSGSSAMLRANAGQQVSIDLAGGARIVHLSDVPAARDWQEGMLTFVDEPLRAVVDRVNRYAHHRIVVDDAVLGELQFTGTVRRDGIEEWAGGLDRVFPVQVERNARGEFHIARRGPQH